MDVVNKETGKTLAQALVEAQSEMVNPKFDSVNPHFKKEFASLVSVREAVVGPLNKHGIAVVQKFKACDSGVTVCTVLVHESGEQMDGGEFHIPVEGGNPQAYCSASTYARRYGLQAVACVVGDADDDGEGATDHSRKPTPRPEPIRQPQAAPAKAPAKAPENPRGGATANTFTVETQFDRVSSQNGQSAKGPWIRTYAKGDDDEYYSTFDTKLGDKMKELKGQRVSVIYKLIQGPTGESRTVLSIGAVEQEEPPYEKSAEAAGMPF